MSQHETVKQFHDRTRQREGRLNALAALKAAKEELLLAVEYDLASGVLELQRALEARPVDGGGEQASKPEDFGLASFPWKRIAESFAAEAEAEPATDESDGEAAAAQPPGAIPLPIPIANGKTVTFGDQIYMVGGGDIPSRIDITSGQVRGARICDQGRYWIDTCGLGVTAASRCFLTEEEAVAAVDAIRVAGGAS